MQKLCLLVAFTLAASVAAAQSVYIEDLTWPEVRDAIKAGKTTAIVYTGSTEQKGPHMAIGEHNVVAHFVAGRIAEVLGDALVFPTMPFALAGDPVAHTGHMRFPGTVSLSREVFMGVVRQVALSAISAGFTQVYLMGDHGEGQVELKLAADGLDADWAGKGVRVRYVPDLYYKERDETNKYLEAVDRFPLSDRSWVQRWSSQSCISWAAVGGVEPDVHRF